jgi:cytochrome c oxidase subunit 2
VLWVAAAATALQTLNMTTARANTPITASHIVGCVLLGTLSAAVAQTTEPEPIRTIDVALSRFAFEPERIEVRVGERVRLNVRSMDSAHGFQVKELDLLAHLPARGHTVIELAPTKAGAYRVACSEYCGIGHSRMKAWLIVTPGT